VLLNYDIGRFVLGSMCVGDPMWLRWSGNSVAQSQAPDDGYSNVRNMLST